MSYGRSVVFKNRAYSISQAATVGKHFLFIEDFLEAIGASVVGYYLGKFVDYAVKAIKDRLNNR